MVEIRSDDNINFESATILLLFSGNSETPKELVIKAYENGTAIVGVGQKCEYLRVKEDARQLNKYTWMYIYHRGNNGFNGENNFLKKLEKWLDPIRNPLIVYIFNFAMFVLLSVSLAMIYGNIGGIHFYIISILCLCLFFSLNWFVYELRKEKLE